jgi:hypothetical protein
MISGSSTTTRSERSPDDHHAHQQAEQQGNAQNRDRLGANRLASDGRRVDDAHVANRPGLGYPQLLGGVEQLGIQPVRDFDIARQTQNRLLRIGQGARPRRQTACGVR